MKMSQLFLTCNLFKMTTIIEQNYDAYTKILYSFKNKIY